MPRFNSEYLLDADVLGHIQDHPDSTRIYAEIVEGIEAGKVRTVRQVMGELKRFPEAFSALSPVRAKFEIEPRRQFCEEVSEIIEKINQLAPKLYDQFDIRNPDPADPWLIGVAKVHGFTLVTDENRNSPKRIPMTCDIDELKCRCITGPHFLVETGIVQEIKPEHIDTTAFYQYHG